MSSQGLFVMQIEVDVYNLLKMWVYVRLHPDCTGSWKDVREQTNAYFASRASDMNCFLETDEGKPFIPAFRSIRLRHAVNDLRSIQLLDTDRIIPQGIHLLLCFIRYFLITNRDYKICTLGATSRYFGSFH